jgi:hypothetical protein
MASGQRRGLRITAIAALAVGFAVAHFNRLASDHHRNEDVRTAARLVTAFDESAPVFVLSGYMSKPLARYLPAEHPPYPLPDEGGDGTGGDDVVERAIALVRSHVAPGEAFWLVYSREFHGDPRGRLLASLKERFSLVPQQKVAGVELFLGRSR